MSVPALRFKEFSGDWEEKKLGDIATVSSGGTPSRTNTEFWNGDIPWVTTSEVKFNRINDTAQKITEHALNNSSAKMFPKNTLLIAMYGEGKTRGQVAKLEIEATTNQACAAIILKNHNSDFFFQYLQNNYENIRNLSNDGGQKNLSGSLIKSISVLYPSLQEQTKIANFLTAVDDKISLLTQKASLLNQYKKGVMQQIFSQELRFKDDDGQEFPEWEEKTLGEIGIFKSGIGFPDKEQGGNSGIPFYKVSDMNLIENKLEMLVANNYVNETQIKKMKFKVISDEAIIFAKVGAAIFLERKRKAKDFLIDNNMMAFIPTSYINFIKHFMDSIRLSKFAQVGALPSYNASDLSIIEIKLPSLSEQTKIAKFLTAIDEKITNNQNQLNAVKQYKQGLLQQMFV